MAIRISVKGTEEQARAAMNARGVTGEPAPAVKGANATPSSNTSFFDVADHHIAKIVQWFCEPSVCALGKGFPAGTLLFYR